MKMPGNNLTSRGPWLFFACPLRENQNSTFNFEELPPAWVCGSTKLLWEIVQLNFWWPHRPPTSTVFGSQWINEISSSCSKPTKKYSRKLDEALSQWFLPFQAFPISGGHQRSDTTAISGQPQTGRAFAKTNHISWRPLEARKKAS